MVFIRILLYRFDSKPDIGGIPVEDRNNPENQALATMQGIQASMWDIIAEDTDGDGIQNPFAPDPEEEAKRRKLALHKAWLESLPREYPSPYERLKIGVYIRFFNQTKYSNYLEYHKQQFVDTIGLCPNWELVDFYVDDGQTAPHMESAAEWCRLLDDCFSGKINLIITQKVTNVTRDPNEITFLARALATQRPPVGIYFVNENMYTLASYYRQDMQETGFIPPDLPPLPDDGPQLLRGELDE